MNRTWTERAYCLFPIFDPRDNHPDKTRLRLMGMGGKAVGLRSDGIKLTAAVILPNIWPVGFDWIRLANERLDTLLDDECHCSQFAQCPKHQLLAQQWAATDLGNNAIVPEMVPDILQGIVTPKKPKSAIILM